MGQLFDYLNPAKFFDTYQPFEDINQILKRDLQVVDNDSSGVVRTSTTLSVSLMRRYEKILSDYSDKVSSSNKKFHELSEAMSNEFISGKFNSDLAEYLRDASERAVLTLDTLRKRGDNFISHEENGCPPVLAYQYEVVMEGSDLPHPSNYTLLKILPPKGVEINDSYRPYIIIDPRAGHGPGIGGFKKDSQVGVALQSGHPVYFVSFHREPEPNQYLSCVTRSEAAFVREVMRLHPKAEKPVVVGNCQGGWATLLLAATNPDITGPIVINGAPVAPWSGIVGENSMRYNAGVLGGTWIPMLLSDIGGGIFDGAHLVQNFELLNPSRTLYRKYTDLFRNIDKGDKTFLEFETWWGGYFLMQEAEIRWIVEQLFIGNRLVKNEARIEPGRPIDLKMIRAPIIVFASHGDNITPPTQALDWIKETYADVNEIKIRGKKIIYMVHDQVGHLGIFVSSQVAKREHAEVASTLETIESLPPGLYEMQIEDISEADGEKSFTVSFAERTLDDIDSYDDKLDDEQPFAAVARTSEIQAQFYESLIRPLIQSMITPSIAEASRVFHPQRISRAAISSQNPLIKPIEALASEVKKSRVEVDPSNPFLALEDYVATSTEQFIDFWRDIRDMNYELMFYGIWGSPMMQRFGKNYEGHRTLKTSDELRILPEVVEALERTETGGFPEAVIRMLILLADSRGSVRKDRLERSNEVLNHCEPFSAISQAERNHVIQEQTLIVRYAQRLAIQSLPVLLVTKADRDLALKVVHYIVGNADDMNEGTHRLIDQFHQVLNFPAFNDEITKNPLTHPKKSLVDLSQHHLQ
jgi:pimeloyl-ACP methyl ester carboxylesterase